MAEPPAVSIVMATLDAARFLAEALASIARQDFTDHETIVVDGGSRDASRAIAAAHPGVRLLDAPVAGFARAWNVGIAAARGALVCFLDADDRWVPDKLARQVARFAADPGLACCAGQVRYFREPGDPLPPGFKPRLLEGSHPAWMPGTSMMRRHVFAVLGPFEDRWDIAADLAWFAVLRESGLRTAMIDAVLLEKRVHAANLGNVTAPKPAYRREVLAVAREALLRRRGKDPGRGGDA